MTWLVKDLVNYTHFHRGTQSLILLRFVKSRLQTVAHVWINSYLSSRTQRVFFNGSLANIIEVDSGIPQGSCLGPLFLSIFTNNMPLTLSKARVSIYADDSTLYMSATTATEMTATHKELQLVSEREWEGIS